jgi:hypothetical protein
MSTIDGVDVYCVAATMGTAERLIDTLTCPGIGYPLKDEFQAVWGELLKCSSCSTGVR